MGRHRYRGRKIIRKEGNNLFLLHFERGKTFFTHKQNKPFQVGNEVPILATGESLGCWITWKVAVHYGAYLLCEGDICGNLHNWHLVHAARACIPGKIPVIGAMYHGRTALNLPSDKAHQVPISAEFCLFYPGKEIAIAQSPNSWRVWILPPSSLSLYLSPPEMPTWAIVQGENLLRISEEYPNGSLGPQQRAVLFTHRENIITAVQQNRLSYLQIGCPVPEPQAS